MTNNLCKSYIKQVKMFFPTVSMKERIYIKKLSDNIIEYCDVKLLCFILLVSRIAILAKENADFQKSLIHYQERVILD